MEPGQHGVHNPFLHEQETPEDGDRHAPPQNGGEIIHRAEEVDALQLRAQQYGDKQGEGQLDRDGQQNINAGDLQGLVELRIPCKNLRVIIPARPSRSVDHVVIRKRVIKRRQERIQLEQKQPDDPW
ncbi:hypothetical protein D3C74_363070 [compost metagenome]